MPIHSRRAHDDKAQPKNEQYYFREMQREGDEDKKSNQTNTRFGVCNSQLLTPALCFFFLPPKQLSFYPVDDLSRSTRGEGQLGVFFVGLIKVCAAWADTVGLDHCGCVGM